MSYNADAQVFETQIVVTNTTQPAGVTSGSIINKGSLSTFDTFVTGHTVINNVKITPNLNDIIYEQQAILNNSQNSWADIIDFYFDDSLTNSFKALINVTVSAGSDKYAIWELNGLYKPSGWVITSSFSGDLTGVQFSILNKDGGIGQIQYQNSNTSGTTYVRYRANTTAPPGSTPLGVTTGIINNTSGPFIPDGLVYASNSDTLATTDLYYTSNVLKVGGSSRLVAEKTSSFVNFSNGGALTSMGDASIAKNLIIGEKIGIRTTSPSHELDVVGGIRSSDGVTTTTLVSTSVTSGSVSSTDLFVTNATIGNLNSSYANFTTATIGSFIAGSGTVGGHLVPSTNIIYDLGSSTQRWRDLYLSGNTIHLGDKQLSLTNDVFQVEKISITSTDDALSVTSAPLLISGGMGIKGRLRVGGTSHLTSIEATSGNITNATAINLVATNISTGSLNFTTLNFQNSTINNLVARTFSAGSVSLSDDLVIEGTLFSPSADIISASFGTLVSSTATITNGKVTNSTMTNAVSTNITSATLNLTTGLTSSSARITNVVSTAITTGTLVGATFIGGSMSLSDDLVIDGTLVSPSADITSASIGTLVSTNGKTTNSTVTNLIVTSLTTGTLAITNISTGSVNATNSTVTNSVATNVSSGTLNLSTGLTSASAQITSLVSTNMSAGSINLSGDLVVGGTLTTVNITTTNVVDTHITSGNINVTSLATILNADVTTSTIATLLNTNIVSTDISSGTLNLSAGLTSTSAQITNANITTSTIATLLNTNIVSTNMSAGSVNLSGDLVVGGTLTTVNITTTNVVDTHITSGNINVTSLATILNANVTTLTAGSIRTSDIALSGNLVATGDITAFGNISDRRFKENIQDITTDVALGKVKSLRPVTFTWKSNIANTSKIGTDDAGFIAQEVEEVVEYAVGEFTDLESGEVYKKINHERIIPYLVGAIQKLEARITELEGKL